MNFCCLAIFSCFGILSFVFPADGRIRRPEEHWRPGQARNLSKYKPRDAVVSTKHNREDNAYVQFARSLKQESVRKQEQTKRREVKGSEVECGIEGPPQALDRIVGGYETEPGQWPWEVALFIDNAWFCGGSLISSSFVLTAAHCVDGASYFDIMAGAHNIRESSEPNRVEITSFNGWTHPQWDPNTLSADLALIELPSPVEWTDYIKPACLPAPGDTADEGELVTCAGWGKPSDSAGGISPVLRMVEDLPLISNAECNAIYGIVDDGQVCIDTAGGKGTCSGDSGGPCMSRWEEDRAPGQKWKQVGIVSFGASAGCEVGYPAGLTRVEAYLDWICQETGVGCALHQ